MHPELLKTFLAVCRYMSVTRGARDRMLTQPAASRQIKQLERRLGVALFEKLGKSMHLTDAGRALVPRAAELLGQMERIAEHVRGFSGTGRGRLRIGASTTPGYYILPPILGEFHRRYPQVELGYLVENTSAIEQRILHNELDIALVGAYPTGKSFRVESVLDDQIVCFGGPSHRLCKRRKIPVAELRDELWVIRERGSATRQLFEKRLSAARGRIGRCIEIAAPEGIKELVSAGIGISFMSAHALRREFQYGRLVPIDVKDVKVARPILAIRHVDKHDAPLIGTFLDLIRRAAT